MNKTISVIVPIYNVEAYLERCIESIVNQTYRNLEIILVDDGSPDGCGSICNQWEKRDSRIKVIHKENGGLSDARNAGMKIATGNYIAYVDSDDWIDSSMYENMMNVLLKEHSDIVSCGFRKVSVMNTNMPDQPITFFQYHNTHDALEALITENGLQQVVWNKLYKRSLVEDILFEKGKYNEDEFWSYQVIGRANKITVLENIYYNYFQREDSIINEAYSLKRLDGLEGKENRQRYIDCFYPELSGIARLNLFYSYMYAYQCILRMPNRNERQIGAKRIESNLSRINLKYSDYKNESIKQKVWIFMGRISMEKMCKLRNKLRIGL